MLEIVVVRHGESIRNFASKLAHQGDLSLLDCQLHEDDYEPGWALTELGKSQAQATGKWVTEALHGYPDLVYSSPYRRTLQTARWMGLGQIPTQDWLLRERRWGDYSQLIPAYSAQQYMDDLHHAGEPHWRPAFPGAESVQDLIPHLKHFVMQKLRHLDDKKIVLVTHGGAMKALQTVLEGKAEDPHQTAVPNASALWIKLDSIDEKGRGHGDVELATPWQPDHGQAHWQHFG